MPTISMFYGILIRMFFHDTDKLRISARVGHPFRHGAATCYGEGGRLLWSRPGSPKEGVPDMVE